MMHDDARKGDRRLFAAYAPIDARYSRPSRAGDHRRLVMSNTVHEADRNHRFVDPFQRVVIAMLEAIDLRTRAHVPRKKVTQATRKQAIRTVAARYQGRCPICRTVQIVNPHTWTTLSGKFHLDHWYGLGHAEPQHIVPCCPKCNVMLGAPGSVERKKYENRFIAYQENRSIECGENFAQHRLLE